MNHLGSWWQQLVAQYSCRQAVMGAGQWATYRGLHQMVLSTAQTLQQWGVGPGSKVILLFPNRPNFLVAFLGVVTAGGIPCPLNPNLTRQELDQLVTVLDPHLVVSHDLPPDVTEFLQQRLPIANFHLWHLQPTPIQIPLATQDPELDDVACMLCTSGTTGLPKAVMLTHTNILSNVQALATNAHWSDQEIFGNALPSFHIYGLTVLTLLPLFLGGIVVYMPQFSPQSCLGAIEQHQITRFGGVPNMFAMLNKYRQAHTFDTRSCQAWISGGAPLSSSVVSEFAAKYNGALIYEGYGMLEASPGISWNLDKSSYHRTAVGRPLAGVHLQIRDPQGQPLPQGKIGSIWVKSPGVMKGYYRNPAATDEAIQAGWLKTGDLGRQDPEGYLYLMGRQKNVMIVGGHNVYPQEVETVLLMESMIADAAVVSRTSLSRGEEIIAFVVPVSQAQLDKDQLQRLCRQSLAPYKRPRQIIAIPSIPRNDSGKVLRQQLLAFLEEQCMETT